MAETSAGSLIWNLDVDVSDFFDKLDDVSERVNRKGKEIGDSFQKTTEAVGKSFKKAGESISETGQALVKIGAAPTLALVGVAKAAMDFETSFTGVRKTVELSEKEFSKLSTNFRNISKDTPLAINDLNRIGEIAGSLGIAGVANITKFTKTIAQIGITTDLTEEEAARSFGTIINVMQESVDNVDRMASTVVGLGNKFNATEPQITAFAERIAGAGRIAGLSTANVLSIGTAMASVGIEAEAGGTAVQRVLISMYQAASGSTSAIIDNSGAIAENTTKLSELQGKLKLAQQRQSEFGDKTKQSTRMLNEQNIKKYSDQISALNGEMDALNATNGLASVSADGFAKVLGVTNKQFSELFKKDPARTFETFVLKLGEMSKEGGDAVAVLEELELADARLIRSFLSLSNSGDLLTRTLREGDKEWENNNALVVEAEKRYATTSSQIQIAKNRLNDIGITIGAAVLPSLNKLLLATAPMLASFATFAEKNPQLVATFIAVGAAIGGVGIALVALGTIVGAIGTLITGLGVAFAFLISPLGLVVLTVTALAAGMIYLGTQTDLLKSRTDLLKQSTDSLKASQDLLKQKGMELANTQLALSGSALAIERAQRLYNDAVKQYGPNSLEAREAEYNLEVARNAGKEAVKRGEKALQEYTAQEKATAKAQADHRATIEQSEGAWYRFRDAVSSVLGVLRDIQNFDFRSIGNAIGGLKGKIPGFAGGVTNFTGGPAIVGEQGPELVNLPQGSDVIPHRKSMDMLSGLDQNRGGGNPLVVIENMIVKDQTDARAFAREIAFRVETSPTYIDNG